MNNSILFKYSLLIFIVSFSGLILFLSSESSVGIHIVVMVFLCLSAIVMSGFDLLHPYFWYSSMFTLYSVSYPILYKFDIVTQFGYSKELMILQWLALSVFLIVVTPIKAPKLYTENIFKVSIINKFTVNILCLVLIIASVYISFKGYSNKKQIYSENNIFLTLTFSLAIILTIIYMYQIINYMIINKKIDMKLMLKVFISIGALTTFSGERDLLFRFIIVSILILYVFKKIKNYHLVLATPLFIISLPLSHIYKYYFLTGSVGGSGAINWNSIFFEFLDGEFISASRNLQVLLNSSDYTKGLFGGYTIFNDVYRVFFPSNFSHGDWYNSTFFPHVKTTGYGFTLVGEGYVNWGYFGVVFLFTVIALLIRYLYINSYKNIYYFVIYLYSIPIYMYAIRADLANILSPFVKHLLLSILIIYILEKLFKKSQKIKENSNKEESVFYEPTNL